MVLQQYSQIVHDDAKHTGSAKRDTANGVAGIDASKELINDVPVSLLVDMDKQSFTNLLSNHVFRSWSAGVAATPDGWAIEGIGGIVGREDTIIKHDTYSAKVTKTASNVFLYHRKTTIDYRNIMVTLTAWVYADIADTVRIEIYDGISASLSAFHPGDSTWKLLSVSRTCDVAATMLQSSLSIITNNAVAYFDGVTLVEGPVCPASSPKPLVDDGIMLQYHTPSTANDYGKAGQWCYDASFIYICTATDTWKRVGIAGW